MITLDERIDKITAHLIGTTPENEADLQVLKCLILENCSYAADSSHSLNRFERLFEEFDKDNTSRLCRLFVEDKYLVALLMVLFGSSHVLSETLLQNHSYIWMLNDGFLKKLSKEDMAIKLTEELALVDGGFEIVRRFKKKELFRIGLMELGGMMAMRYIMESLADLADVVVDATYRLCVEIIQKDFGRPLYIDEDGKESEVGFSVIAMGKMGGRELNFSSDIDLVFVYGDEGKTEGREEFGRVSGVIENHIYFTKVAILLIEKLEELTGDWYCYRVDMRLRPEGSNGVLVRSIRSYEGYYSAWGETWERQALIKARACAGDIAVGDEFLKMLEPFIYRKYMDIAAINEIGQVKKRIDFKIASKNTTYHHVKLGYGGIREVEFIVQCFQIVYGGKNEKIRNKRTLDTVDLLLEHGYFSAEEHGNIRDAYLFLRNVESKLQIFLEMALYVIPDNVEDLAGLAYKLNYRNYDDNRAVDIFIKDYEYYRGKVRQMFEFIFAEDGEEKKISIPIETRIVNQHKIPSEEVYDLLRRCGVEDLSSGYRNLMMVAKGRDSEPPYTIRLKRLMENFLPLLLEGVKKSADADHSLVFFETFIIAVGAKEAYIKLLLENPPVIELVTKVFGSSEVISNIIISKPAFFDSLITSGLTDYYKGGVDMIEDLDLNKNLCKEDIYIRIRDYKKQEMIRIGIRDILELSTIEMVMGELTLLADILLEFAFKCAFRLKGVSQRSIAVFALGKQGGHEMNYGSDLDILMVCRDDEDFELVNSLASNVVKLLSEITSDGYAYKVDTRLRPFGAAGSLVPSHEQLTNYLTNSAETWERQAFTKVRFVCGDKSLGDQVESTIESFVYSRSLNSVEFAAIDHMRKRMAQELVPQKHAGRDVKLSRGGLVDIQFVLQMVQLKLGVDYQNIRSASLFTVLKELKNSVPEHMYAPLTVENLDLFTDALTFIITLESKLRIWEDRPNDIIPTDPSKLNALARKLGYYDAVGLISPGERLLEAFALYKSRVMAIYDKYVEV